MISRRHPTLLFLVAVIAVVAPLQAAPGAQQADDRAENMYMQAESELAAGDTAAALRLFATIVSEYPRSRFPESIWRGAAAVRAGEIEMGRGRDGVAAGWFVTVIEGEGPSAASSRARYGLASAMLVNGEWRAAANLLQGIVTEADSGAGQVDPNVAMRARARLDMVHRLWLRPIAGELPWTQSGGYPAATGLERPVGVAVSGNGEVLISDEGARAVFLVDTSGNTASITAQDVRRPWWSPTGSAYVATKTGVAAPLRGESYSFAIPDRGQQRPLRDVSAGFRGGAGEWLLLDSRARSVAVFSPDGDWVRSLDLGPRGEPVDVAVDQGGNAYVIEKETRSVLFFTPDGADAGGFSLDSWREPYAVATDGAGNVYVLDRSSKRISVFDPQGGIRWSVGPVLPGGVELRDPRDLAVDGAGRIFIADRGLASVVLVQ